MPTKCNLVYLTPAEQDILDILRFHVTEVGVPSSRKIYQTIKQTIGRLRQFPLMGQTHPDPMMAAEGFRKLVLTKTYVAVYKVERDTVFIYRVVNGAMDYPNLLK